VSGVRGRGGHDDSDYRYRFLSRFGSVILSGGIAAIPKALYMYSAELGLVPQEVWFVGYILAHRWTAELPFPSLRKMSVHTGVSPQMLHRYKNSLIEKGYLETIPRTRPSGGRTSNYYDFSGLFQQLELLLIRDNGGRPEDLEGDEEEGADQPQYTPPGKPQFTGPGKSGLSGAGKRGATGPANGRAQHVNRDMHTEPNHEGPADKFPSRRNSRPTTFRPFQGNPLDSRQAWATALMDLRTVSGAESYLKGSKLLARDGDELVVGVSSAYAAEWLERRIAQRSASVLSALGGEPVGVRFVAENDWRG
jgi:hypothetical protein